MNDTLKQLLELQKIDRVIDDLTLQLESLPEQVEEKRSAIREGKESVEQEKGRSIAAQLKRKNKEMELNTQEEKIRKHEAELNAIKSNEAYKALLSEISAARKAKNGIEDEILNLMEEADKIAKEIEKISSETKLNEKKIETEIQACEEEIKKVKLTLDDELQKRGLFVSSMPQEVLVRYDYIRNKKKSIAIVAISGECCTGCNTNLTQSTINEVKKGKELILCDVCSRILYFAGPVNSAAVVP